MTADAADKSVDRVYLRWLALTALAGAAIAGGVPLASSEKTGALIGVAGAAGCGLLALYLKRWATERSLKDTLWMVTILFMVRLIVLGAAISAARPAGYGLVAFLAGFFGVYFVLQWIEIGYLARERNRATGGGG